MQISPDQVATGHLQAVRDDQAQKQGLPQHPESLELEIVLLQSVPQF